MKKTLILFFLFLSAKAIFCQANVSPQSENSKPFILGVIDEIFSKELGEKRILNIYLPEGIIKMTR